MGNESSDVLQLACEVTVGGDDVPVAQLVGDGEPAVQMEQDQCQSVSASIENLPNPSQHEFNRSNATTLQKMISAAVTVTGVRPNAPVNSTQSIAHQTHGNQPPTDHELPQVIGMQSQGQKMMLDLYPLQ